MRTQLLCTFTNESEFENILESVNGSFELYSRKIFILKLSPSTELVVSYNIIPSPNNKFLPNTILTHRKKESNTLYTINALISLIAHLNGGIVDKSYMVNWEDYRNSMILTDGDGFKVLKTSLFRIVNVN